MLVKFLTLLRSLEPNRHFLKLWGSQLLSLIAFNMVNFTLLLKVYDLTHSSTLVSLFVLSFGIPSLLFGALAGVYADRWNRRTTLVFTNLLRTVFVLVYLVSLDSIVLIYATTFVIATITQFFTPAEGALIPELVERRRLVAANAIFMVTMFASFVIGYGVAGPLGNIGGDHLPILLAAWMFGLATIFCATLPKREDHGRAVAFRAAYAGVNEALRDGLRMVRANTLVRYGLAQLTFVWATIGVVMVILPAFTTDVLGLNLREVSRLIILPIGVGMLFGGFLLHRARKQFRLRTIMLWCLLLAGVCVITLGQLSAVAGWLDARGLLSDDRATIEQIVTSGAATLLGLALSTVMIAAQTLIHEHSDPAGRGRIFGVLGMSVNAANTLPVLIAGAITDLISVTVVVTAIGIGLIMWGVLSRFVLGRKHALDTASPNP